MFFFEHLKLGLTRASEHTAVVFLISWKRHTSCAQNSQLEANHDDLN